MITQQYATDSSGKKHSLFCYISVAHLKVFTEKTLQNRLFIVYKCAICAIILEVTYFQPWLKMPCPPTRRCSMNGNRSRYSSNPTFNMQKRGLFKKSSQLPPEKPDFGVQQDTGAVPQTFFSQPSPMQNQSIQAATYAQLYASVVVQ